MWYLSQKISIVITNTSYKRLEYWVEECLSKGKMAFSLTELKSNFSKDSDISLKRQLDRLSEKGKVVSILKGYYIIIPPQYATKGILPPTMFIDGLMKYLGRNYYVGLLNAAALFGASHQQPQEYFVVTEYPVLRTTIKKGLKINYISTGQFPTISLIEQKKTDVGYISISIPLLTAIDMIKYEKKIGGLSRASTVIGELVESINKKDISLDLINHANISTIQRFGYILEEILAENELAEKLFTICKNAKKKFYLIPLKASGIKDDRLIINIRWKLKINTEIEID